MNVLIVIDMQEASFAQGKQHDIAGVIGRINSLASTIRDQSGHVIFIQHDGSPSEGLAPFSEGWKILSSLTRSDTDYIIRKDKNDAFADTTLASTLQEMNVERVVICGWATDFCVDTTIRSAISQNLNVLVASDAHTLTDREHLTATQVIGHHNWLWQNLITSTSTISVENTEQILASLSS